VAIILTAFVVEKILTVLEESANENILALAVVSALHWNAKFCVAHNRSIEPNCAYSISYKKLLLANSSLQPQVGTKAVGLTCM